MLPELPLLLFGTVVDTKDEAKLGRIQVKLTGFAAEVALPWLRVLQPTASALFGSFFLPELNDEVAILRGAGNDPDSMVVLGALYNGKNKPFAPDADGKNNLKEIRTRTGHALTFSDKEGEESITLASGDGKLSIVINQKEGSIAITTDKALTITSKEAITVDGKDITVTASGKLGLKGDKVAIEGSSGVEIKDGSAVKVSGGKVQIAGTAVEIG